MMNASDLFPVAEKATCTAMWSKPYLVIDMPCTDAVRWICNDKDLGNFISIHGDVEIVAGKDGYYSVPEFAAGRKEYSDAKQVWCNQYGCE